jgi:putative copper export protein
MLGQLNIGQLFLVKLYCVLFLVMLKFEHLYGFNFSYVRLDKSV